MVFSSAIFIFGFLPLLFLVLLITRPFGKSIANYVLLIFSLVFYAFGGVRYVLVLIAVVLIDYVGALLIGRAQKGRRSLLAVVVTANVAVLCVFKYLGFLTGNIEQLTGIDIPIPEIVLPIGISFYIFQSLSYVIDVYRKKVDVQKNFFILLLYVCMFPQLVAGPIVRYETIELEFKSRKVTLDDFSYGIERFILGFAKKIIIANQMGELADLVFSSDPMSTPVAWLGAFAYMFQIYFDFSAYSDMAIGLGRMLGFHFLENFNFPYISKSITEFWRRWHISLSTWFRDYIYIPLGGNRKGVARQIINMAIVWALTGLWHGAAWNFVIWGLYYFVFLVLEKYVLKNVLKKWPAFFQHFYVLFIVLIGWIIFRSDDMAMFTNMMSSMFSFDFSAFGLAEASIYLQTYWLYFILAIVFSMPVYYLFRRKTEHSRVGVVIRVVILLALFVISIIFLAESSYNPFIYFRF